MALNSSSSGNLEQLALKGLTQAAELGRKAYGLLPFYALMSICLQVTNWSRLVLLRSSVITVGDETIPLTGYFMDGIPPLAKCGWVPFTDLRLRSMATK